MGRLAENRQKVIERDYGSVYGRTDDDQCPSNRESWRRSMEDGKLKDNGEDNLWQDHSQDTYAFRSNTEEIPRYKPRENPGLLFLFEVPSSKVSSRITVSLRGEDSSDLTWALNPSTLIRSSMNTDKMRVGMTGWILNNIILERALRSYLETN
jgi:hypothetical protein